MFDAINVPLSLMDYCAQFSCFRSNGVGVRMGLKNLEPDPMGRGAVYPLKHAPPNIGQCAEFDRCYGDTPEKLGRSRFTFQLCFKAARGHGSDMDRSGRLPKTSYPVPFLR